MQRTITALTVLLVLVSLAPAPAAAGAGQGEAYAGSHVSFGTNASAVTDYAVDGEAVLSSVRVKSASDAEGSGLVDVGASLSAVTSLEGAGLSLAARTETSATVDVEGSASMDAHDNGHGVLVVRAGGEAQYVEATLGEGAEATAESDSRVTVTTANGTEGTLVVAGDGRVAVNERGDVVARLGSDGRLVFRAYPDGRSDDDAAEERLIAESRAAGEVHVMTRGGETVVDAVRYGNGTALDARQSAEGEVTVTVDRAAHEGQVVLSTVSASALDASGDLSVEVDGRAAARADSYADLRSAIGSDRSQYLVRGAGDADASATVLVAVNHFSERTVTLSEADGGAGDGGGDGADDGDGRADADGSGSADGSDGSGATDGASTPGQPGFGAGIAVLAVLAAVLVARYRR